MIENQYIYEWTEEDQKRHDEMVRNFSVSMIHPVCLMDHVSHPAEAKTYYDFLVAEVAKEPTSLEKYNKFKKLTQAWERFVDNATGFLDFSIAHVLQFA